MKKACAFLLVCAATGAWGQGISYDMQTNVLTIPSVQVNGGPTYTNVTLQNTGNYHFALLGATSASITGAPLATYANGILTLPSVNVGGTVYSVSMLDTGGYTFSLQSADQVQPYIFYSASSTSPQTATLSSNGTLKMDGLSLTGFVFAGSATDASGTLTNWAAPGSNWNQPNVPVMLFCKADNKIAYVLLRSAADDPSRSQTTVPILLSAIQGASQYSGISVYTNCSGTFTSAWNNNKPNTNFYLWPDVFTTYSYAYVANRLNGAPVFFASGSGTANPDNYLAITWPMTGAPSFQVWK